MIPKFSIIVPCYNLESWIRDCLDSVAAQSFSDWECIVIDDESHDGSPVICDAYAAKDPKFKIIHQKNAGEGGARNAGLAIAKGEWIFFLDGDDVMAPDALDRLSKIIASYPEESLIRFGFADFEDGLSFPIVDQRQPASSQRIDISRQIKYDDYYVYVWQFIFHRTLIDGMKFDRYKRGADRTFIVPVLCLRANSFVSTNEVYYFYRQRQGSAVHKRPSVKVLKDELSHRVDMIEAMDKSGKKIDYRGYWGLEGYCVQRYQRLVYGLESQYPGSEPDLVPYSTAERAELVDWFYHELSRINSAKGFRVSARVACWLYRFCSSERGWYFVSTAYWVLIERALIILLNPVRVFRAMYRRIRRMADRRSK